MKRIKQADKAAIFLAVLPFSIGELIPSINETARSIQLMRKYQALVKKSIIKVFK